MRPRKPQSGQVLVIVAVWMVALIGISALVLLAGSVEWQRNQLQQVADQAALDAALKIGVGCSAASANTVITAADDFVFADTQRARMGSLSISGALCATPFTGTDTFAGGLSETVHYPYRQHQQQVEVILTLSLPISFGSYMGATNTTVTRRAVAQQLSGSTTAVEATNLACTGGQFNVAGSVEASSRISFTGGCAVYAHSRLDAPSSTYSDLGDVSVYTGGQTWVGLGGRCVAGANSGSVSALCADGYELSGNTSTACGTAGISAFLSAADAAVNPNPCAGGTGAQPVAALSTTLPPEPNADPAIIATLPGGAACSPAATYGPVVVNGTTVGTSNAGPTTTDPAGWIHFKKGCYGYLDVGNLGSGGTITNRQTGPEIAAQNKIDPTLPLAAAAGTLVVVTLHLADGGTSITGPGGSWTLAASAQQAGEGWNQIWYLPGSANSGGVLTPEWKVIPGSIDAEAQMTEWSGAAASNPLDQTGTTTLGVAAGTAAVSTSPTTAANELVLTSDGFQSLAGQTFTPAAAYTSLVNDAANGYASEYRLNAATGVQSEIVTASKPSLWSLAMATFKPSGGATPPGAVLDPGFYYFNGTSFAGGGGGLCLHGGTLLARDVTLEFANAAGFSSGTCAVGGGSACATVTCQFGSAPCSISPCPPNAAADPAGGGFTWFASPCSSAPTGDSAACAGSAWCVTGDRACWNLLIWAPSGSTGQIAITGTSAKAWLLGSVFWPSTCTDAVNGTSTLDGTISCTTLNVSAAVGAGTAAGSDYGINTALVEAVLVE